VTPLRPSPLPAYATAIAGIGLFSIMDMVIKVLVIADGAFSTMFYRSMVGLGLAALLALVVRPGRPSRAAMRLHIMRGMITALMSVLFFWGLARVPMAEAVALSFIAPLLALVLAALILHESLGRKAIGASLLAALGVIVIFVGQARAQTGREALVGSGAIIVSAILYAWNIVIMRQQALAAKPVEIALFQNLVFFLTMFAVVPVVGLPAPPSGHWIELFIAASLALASNLLLAWAYARAGAGYLSSTEYSSFLWAMALGWLRFGEAVSPFTLAGAGLILAGCFIAARAVEHPTLEGSA
jgi:S-adenosylmethionine uptake transporter